jgi:hypothetical protein
LEHGHAFFGALSQALQQTLEENAQQPHAEAASQADLHCFWLSAHNMTVGYADDGCSRPKPTTLLLRRSKRLTDGDNFTRQCDCVKAAARSSARRHGRDRDSFEFLVEWP